MNGHAAGSGLHAEDSHFQVLVLRTLGSLKALSHFISSKPPIAVLNAFISASYMCVLSRFGSRYKSGCTIAVSNHQKRTSFGLSS